MPLLKCVKLKVGPVLQRPFNSPPEFMLTWKFRGFILRLQGEKAVLVIVDGCLEPP